MALVGTGADVYVRVGLGRSPKDIARMSDGGMIFALANPTPEVHPDLAHRYAAIVATAFGLRIRSTTLAFPASSGRLDSGARQITEAMKLVAARAIADLVVEHPTRTKIVPRCFQPWPLPWRRPPGSPETQVLRHAEAGLGAVISDRQSDFCVTQLVGSSSPREGELRGILALLPLVGSARAPRQEGAVESFSERGVLLPSGG